MRTESTTVQLLTMVESKKITFTMFFSRECGKDIFTKNCIDSHFLTIGYYISSLWNGLACAGGNFGLFFLVLGLL